MVHADASTFQQGLSKAQVYDQIIEQAGALFDGQRNWVCNLANTSSLIYHGLKALDAPSSAINWAGFYIVYPEDEKKLVLGPFHGQVACQTIALGRGVCGTAASSKQTVLVHDVHKFPGHIACDANSQSEIVIPIVQGGKVVGIIDIDCAQLNGFDEEDQRQLEKLADLISQSSDFPIR